jgi:hypothetical protein
MKPAKFTEEQLLEGEVKRCLTGLYDLEARARESRAKAPTSAEQHDVADVINRVVYDARVDLRKAERALQKCREGAKR